MFESDGLNPAGIPSASTPLYAADSAIFLIENVHNCPTLDKNAFSTVTTEGNVRNDVTSRSPVSPSTTRHDVLAFPVLIHTRAPLVAARSTYCTPAEAGVTTPRGEPEPRRNHVFNVVALVAAWSRAVDADSAAA